MTKVKCEKKWLRKSLIKTSFHLGSVLSVACPELKLVLQWRRHGSGSEMMSESKMRYGEAERNRMQ